MGVLAEVLLGDLQLQRQRRAGHRAEQLMERLAGLEIERTIFHLDHRAGVELAVQRFELVVRLADAIGAVVAVNEGPPHDDAAVRRQRGGQHVGAVGVGVPVVGRPRLAFGVGLDQEPAEVWNHRVDGVRQVDPPGLDRAVRGVGRGETADLLGRAELGRQVDGDAVRAEGGRQRGHLGQIGARQNLGVGVDVVEHDAVDADGRIGAGVIGVTFRERPRQGAPLPERFAGVSALDAAVEVVPVIEDATLDLGRLAERQAGQRVMALELPQQGERPVKHADVAVPGDDDGRLAADGGRLHQIPFAAHRGEAAAQRQAINDGGRGRRSDHHGARGRRRAHDGDGRPDEAAQPLDQLGLGGLQVAELPAVTIWVIPAWYSASRAGRLTLG